MYVCIYIIYCTKTYYLSLSLHIYIYIIWNIPQQIIPDSDSRCSPGWKEDTDKHAGKQRIAWRQEFGGGDQFW